MSGYFYLASAYSKFPGGHKAAFDIACENAALLLNAGISVFCPIAHSHPLVDHGLKAVDHDFWINTVDRPLMEGAKGLIFLEMDGWQQSSGMMEEIVHFVKAGKPVVFMQPGEVPEELVEGPSAGAIYAPATTDDWPEFSPIANPPSDPKMGGLRGALWWKYSGDEYQDQIMDLYDLRVSNGWGSEDAFASVVRTFGEPVKA
jgi:hypothetical protein